MTKDEAQARERRGVTVIVIGFLALFILSSAWLATITQAAIFSGGASTVEDNEDVIFVTVTSAANTDYDVTITRYKDLNNDGDLADAGESANVVFLNDVNECVAVAVSCALTNVANARSVVIFRNATAEHSPGNYSFILRSEDAIGGVVDIFSTGFTIKDVKATATTHKAQHEGTRALINQSYANVTQNVTLIHSNLTTNFPFTWNLINTTAPGNGGCDTRCQQNISNNVTSNFTLFASDCHGTGTGLCINGHVAALEDTALLRSLGVFAWLLIIAVLSHVTRMNRMILVILALLPIMYVLGNLAAFEPEMLIAILIGCTAVFIALAFPQETPDRA